MMVMGSLWSYIHRDTQIAGKAVMKLSAVNRVCVCTGCRMLDLFGLLYSSQEEKLWTTCELASIQEEVV